MRGLRMIRMDEVNQIRKDFFSRGKNRNQIANKYKRAWKTVSTLVKMSREDLENRGKHPPRSKQVMTPEVIQAIESYFDREEELRVKKKQKYTAAQIFRELKEQGIYKGKIRRMEEMVSLLRKKRGQTKVPSFLALEFPIGSTLQLDHGECEIQIEEERFKGYLFVASVPGQVLRYCQIYPTKARETWGEFHDKAFRFFGGVFPKIMYDNDKVLVKKVMGSDRKQTTFSLTLEEHYGFESQFCNVGAGNEKGAVENGVGYCRRRFLPGLPVFKSWESANEFLSSCCLKDIKTGVHYRTQEKLSGLFEETQKLLQPLPPPKTWWRYLDVKVDKCQLITVDHHQYSVPEGYIGSTLRVGLTPFSVEIFKERDQVANHSREHGKKDSLKLDHYLDQLAYKPHAFSHAKVVVQNQFHPHLLQMRERLAQKYGHKEANKQFVSILLLRRHWSQEELLQGVETALYWGAIDCAAVENILRQKRLSMSLPTEEEIKSFIPGKSYSWEFDLNIYKELCWEVAL